MNDQCDAARHAGDGRLSPLTAYVKYRCRCPDARVAYSRYRYGDGQRSTVDATAAVRLVRGLMLRGHSPTQIAEVASLHWNTVLNLSREQPGGCRVHPRTARAVAHAARQLVRVAGRARYAAHMRAQAESAGWAPLHAWNGEHFPIGDASIPDEFAAQVAHLPPQMRRLLLAEHRAEHDAQARLRERFAQGARNRHATAVSTATDTATRRTA